MSDRSRVVLVTGQSGAGKASILRALEDIGYEAIDNPPLTLIEGLVDRVEPAGRNGRIAIGVDARTRGFDVASLLATVGRLRGNPALRLEVVFASADETVLLRRYTETRRRHPLSPSGWVIDGIQAEQALTAPLREVADLLVDTSELPIPELRQLIERRFAPEGGSEGATALSVGLISFAFPRGLPREADMVFDARFLRNPHYVTELKALTGLDARVAAYVEADPDYPEFVAQVLALLGLLLPRFRQEGKKYATIAIGCTGGRHRSVRIVEFLAKSLADTGWRVATTHRELGRDSKFSRQDGSDASGRMSDSPIQAQEA